MRVVKDAEERRNEILNVAEKMFVAKGFDNTSTNDILDKIGIARGTLYYHFKSKEEILDAIIERLTAQLSAKAKLIADRKEIPVMQRLTMAIMALNLDDELANEVMEQAHKTQNALMHQKIRERLLADVNPVITGLIKEGIEHRICQTDYPEEVVDMAMLYSYITFDSLTEYDEKTRQKKVEGFIYNLERMLGMKCGSMQAALIPVFEHNNE